MTFIDWSLVALIVLGVVRSTLTALTLHQISQTLKRVSQPAYFVHRGKLTDEDIAALQEGGVLQGTAEAIESLGDGEAEFFSEPTADEFEDNERKQKPKYGIVEKLKSLFH